MLFTLCGSVSVPGTTAAKPQGLLLYSAPVYSAVFTRNILIAFPWQQLTEPKKFSSLMRYGEILYPDPLR